MDPILLYVFPSTPVPFRALLKTKCCLRYGVGVFGRRIIVKKVVASSLALKMLVRCIIENVLNYHKDALQIADNMRMRAEMRHHC